ncbi:MAG: dTDP-4-dehydrorhamnose 3,5-epimerase, partial [uncultured Actinomycetospora sp.]
GGAGAGRARRVAVQPAGVPRRAGRVRGALPGGGVRRRGGAPAACCAGQHERIPPRGPARGALRRRAAGTGQVRAVQRRGRRRRRRRRPGRLADLRGLGRRAPRRRRAAGGVPGRGPRARVPRARRRQRDHLPVLAGVRARHRARRLAPRPGAGAALVAVVRGGGSGALRQGRRRPDAGAGPRRRDAADVGGLPGP